MPISNSLDLISDCPKYCPLHYSPLCGSDGRTYANECGFKIAQCYDKSLKYVKFGRCEDNDIFGRLRNEGKYFYIL